MTAGLQAQVADHEARSAVLEKSDDERRDGIKRIEDAIAGQQKWLMGVMASAILSLLATIFALLSGRGIAVPH